MIWLLPYPIEYNQYQMVVQVQRKMGLGAPQDPILVEPLSLTLLVSKHHSTYHMCVLYIDIQNMHIFFFKYVSNFYFPYASVVLDCSKLYILHLSVHFISILHVYEVAFPIYEGILILGSCFHMHMCFFTKSFLVPHHHQCHVPTSTF